MRWIRRVGCVCTLFAVGFIVFVDNLSMLKSPKITSLLEHVDLLSIWKTKEILTEHADLLSIRKTKEMLTEHADVLSIRKTQEMLTEHADAPPKRKVHAYWGRDLMKERHPEFDPTFKNPCWYEATGNKATNKNATNKNATNSNATNSNTTNSNTTSNGTTSNNNSRSRTPLRCLPYFYLIGVKKSGTSELFSKIAHHPDFVAGSHRKEVHWFDRYRFDKPLQTHDTLAAYVRVFDAAAKQIQHRNTNARAAGKTNWFITGEATPAYLQLNTRWRELPGNEGASEPNYVILDYIHHFVPSAKIIIVVREPVERLYSEYYHEYLRSPNNIGVRRISKNYHANPRDFHEIVTKGIRLYRDCFRHHTVRSCVYNGSIPFYTRMHMELGMVHVYWEELLRVFPRDQIHVVHNVHLAANATDTLRGVFKFLELSDVNESELQQLALGDGQRALSSSSYYKRRGGMLNTTAALLRDFYRPFNTRMSELTNDKTFLYNY